MTGTASLRSSSVSSDKYREVFMWMTASSQAYYEGRVWYGLNKRPYGL